MPDVANTGRSFFDNRFVDEVRSSTDIVELIGESVALRRRGRNHLGLCPFHNEKTASFTVSAEKQIFYCFGCGAGGDVFSYVQKKQGLTFPESVRLLAERAGLRPPEQDLSPAEAARAAELARLRELHEMACVQYERWLWGDPGKPALEYLRRRGLSDQTIKDFRLGWALPGWDGLVQGLGQRGVQGAALVRAGLAGEAEGGKRVYDRFRGRVMFPICDGRGQVIAFGGRVLPGNEDPQSPKYLNSPETDLFVKGRQLYGLHLARPAIRERGGAVIVEGYMDALACHQAGFKHAVASLGTALTVVQGRMLLTMARDISVAYDADAAGQAATLRGLEVLAMVGAEIRVVNLPEGKDPDECIQRGGASAFADALDQAEDYLLYRFRLARAAAEAKYGRGTARAAAATAAAVAPGLVLVASAVARESYVQRFARELGVSEASVLAEVRRAARPAAQAGGGGAPASDAGHIAAPNRDNKGNIGSGLLAGPAYRQAEEQLIAALLMHPELVNEVAGGIEPADFPDEACRHVVEMLLAAAPARADGAAAGADRAAVDPAQQDLAHGLIRALEQQGQLEAASLIGRLAVTDEVGKEHCVRVVQDCVRFLQEHSLGNRIIEVRQEVQRLERAGEPVPSHLLEEYTRLVRSVKGRPPEA
ncbi:MAG: DNA primase [Bacillota bacterium]|nr:DNA primase [Bacillota bacterium]